MSKKRDKNSSEHVQESEDEHKDFQESNDSSMDMHLQDFIKIKSKKKKEKKQNLPKVITRAQGKKN